MARTDDTAVRAVLKTKSELDTASFIDTATALVDWLVTKDEDSEITTALAERIECYLAAHFYSLYDQALQSKNTGRAGGTFQGQTGMVLMSTIYGQTACVLDPTNQLAQRSKDAEAGIVRKASVDWGGTSVDSTRPDSIDIESSEGG